MDDLRPPGKLAIKRDPDATFYFLLRNLDGDRVVHLDSITHDSLIEGIDTRGDVDVDGWKVVGSSWAYYLRLLPHFADPKGASHVLNRRLPPLTLPAE